MGSGKPGGAPDNLALRKPKSAYPFKWWRQLEPSEEWAEKIKAGPFVDPYGRLYGFTPHNLKVFHEYVKTGSRIQAIVNRSRNPNMNREDARMRGLRLFTTPQARAYVLKLMGGVPSVYEAAKVHMDALKAEKTTVSKDGTVRTSPDWAVRQKSANIILKMTGAMDNPNRLVGAALDKPPVEIEAKEIFGEEECDAVTEYFVLTQGDMPTDEERKLLESGEKTAVEILNG